MYEKGIASWLLAILISLFGIFNDALFSFKSLKSFITLDGRTGDITKLEVGELSIRLVGLPFTLGILLARLCPTLTKCSLNSLAMS